MGEMPRGSGVGGTPLRVLLVEDHRDTRDVLRELLQSRGYVVTSVETVRAALSSGADFDVLICDIGLPDGTGYDVARSLSTVPAIAMSACDSADDIAHSRTAGFYTHMVKPISIERLFALLEALR